MAAVDGGKAGRGETGAGEADKNGAMSIGMCVRADEYTPQQLKGRGGESERERETTKPWATRYV